MRLKPPDSSNPNSILLFQFEIIAGLRNAQNAMRADNITSDHLWAVARLPSLEQTEHCFHQSLRVVKMTALLALIWYKNVLRPILMTYVRDN